MFFFHPPRLLTRFFVAFMLALFVSCPVLFWFTFVFFPLQSTITQEKQMAYEGLVESPTPEVSQVILNVINCASLQLVFNS